ncbi:MAG: hypothetical protein WBC44_04295, partial [Planctomycetaceae bacterium]
MAAQSKTTAVHFSLIFFVMLSVILGVVAYLFYSDYREQQVTFLKNKSDLNAAQGVSRKYGEEIAALKQRIGIDRPDVGVPDAPEGSVLALSRQTIQAAMQTLGSNAPDASFSDAVNNLRAELDNKNVALAQRQATIADLQAKVEALNAQYAATAKEHDDARQTTETDLSGVQQQYSESIASKDQEISEVREQNAALQTEIEQTRQQLNAQLAKAQDEITQLSSVNKRLTKELDTIKGESFEVADGVIRRVDQVGRTVWINKGKADNLRERTTFSVYAKNNVGIGREGPQGGRPEDIKGSIEVTRILGDHMAEARILDDDSSRPISPGDPIYTPLWSEGRTEQFAFVGMIDVDNDGNFTGDRERLDQIISANGAEISSEVDDEGERTPKNGEGEPVRIDEQTRFLVVGVTPDPLDVPAGDERERRERLKTHVGEMKREAEIAGVRIVNLNTFLDYIGYVPQQRRWAPGENPSWNLESGSRKTGTSSTGNTSGLFDTSRSRPN